MKKYIFSYKVNDEITLDFYICDYDIIIVITYTDGTDESIRFFEKRFTIKDIKDIIEKIKKENSNLVFEFMEF